MKYLLPILFLGLLFTNCGNDSAIPDTDPVEQLRVDKQLIKDYLLANGLTAQESASGLHYIIEEQGTKDFIDDRSIVNVLFTGYFLDGNQFDGTGDCYPITINVDGVIDGFSEGLQLFNVGGKGKLFIPSGIAFGQVGGNGIPSNSVLAFDIEIVEQKVFERTKIRNYLAENNLTADSTLSGIFYMIEELGEGEHPSSNSTVTVNYRGYFANGETFDQSNTPATFEIKNVIRGWQEVVPLLKIGGRGTFLIPSDLGYGQSGNGTIRGNALLIFDIELLDFRD